MIRGGFAAAHLGGGSGGRFVSLHFSLAAAGLLHGRTQLHGRILLLHLRVDLLYKIGPLARLLIQLARALALSSSLHIILARRLTVTTGCHLFVLLMRRKISAEAPWPLNPGTVSKRQLPMPALCS